MAAQRILIQQKVAEVRRSAPGCRECGRKLPQGLMLGGAGPTFSQLVMTPGMTWENIESEITKRGFMCRGCLNYSRAHTPEAEKLTEDESQVEVLKKPGVREVMREQGMEIPQKYLDLGVPPLNPARDVDDDNNM